MTASPSANPLEDLAEVEELLAQEKEQKRNQEQRKLQSVRITGTTIFERLQEVIVREIPEVSPNMVTEDATFDGDLQTDSLGVTEVFMAIEDEFDIELSEEDCQKTRTVGNVVRYIEDTEEQLAQCEETPVLP